MKKQTYVGIQKSICNITGSQTITSVGKDGKELGFSRVARGNVKWYSSCGKAFGGSSKS